MLPSELGPAGIWGFFSTVIDPDMEQDIIIMEHTKCSGVIGPRAIVLQGCLDETDSK
jgi:hypothetical protein